MLETAPIQSMALRGRNMLMVIEEDVLDKKLGN
jgi:hypothetical protein